MIRSAAQIIHVVAEYYSPTATPHDMTTIKANTFGLN